MVDIVGFERADGGTQVHENERNRAKGLDRLRSFKAWVDGSSPSALTTFLGGLLGR